MSRYPTICVFDLEIDAKNNTYQIGSLGKIGYVPTVEEFTTGVGQMLEKRTK